MPTHTLDDLKTLASGHSISREAFEALLADPDAWAELERLLFLRDLVKGPPELSPTAPKVAVLGEDSNLEPSG